MPRRGWQQSRPASYQRVPELRPIVLVVIDQQCDLRSSPDIAQTCQTLRGDSLRFLIYGAVEGLAIENKTDRHDVRSMLGIHRGKVGDPRAREPLGDCGG